MPCATQALYHPQKDRRHQGHHLRRRCGRVLMRSSGVAVEDGEVEVAGQADPDGHRRGCRRPVAADSAGRRPAPACGDRRRMGRAAHLTEAEADPVVLVRDHRASWTSWCRRLTPATARWPRRPARPSISTTRRPSSKARTAAATPTPNRPGACRFRRRSCVVAPGAAHLCRAVARLHRRGAVRAPPDQGRADLG